MLDFRKACCVMTLNLYFLVDEVAVRSFISVYFMYMNVCPCVCVCTTCIQAPINSMKVSEPLKVEFQVVMGDIGAGNQLGRSGRTLSICNH